LQEPDGLYEPQITALVKELCKERPEKSPKLRVAKEKAMFLSIE